MDVWTVHQSELDQRLPLQDTRRQLFAEQCEIIPDSNKDKKLNPYNKNHIIKKKLNRSEETNNVEIAKYETLKEIKCHSQNVRGLKDITKIEHVVSLMCTQSIDIYFIQETWLLTNLTGYINEFL